MLQHARVKSLAGQPPIMCNILAHAEVAVNHVATVQAVAILLHQNGRLYRCISGLDGRQMLIHSQTLAEPDKLPGPL